MNKLLLFVVALCIIFLYGCSSTEETQKDGEEKKEEVYIFDEIPTDTLVVSKQEEKNTTPPTTTAWLYYVQVGAFTTEQKAQEFAASSKKILGKDLTVSFSKDSSLYVVRLSPTKTKEEADKLRDEIKKYKEFQDVFVVVPE